jgi:hypothetical protein
MSFNFNNNQNNNNRPQNYNKSYMPSHDVKIIQGEKVLNADRDDISNKMSEIRLKSFNNQTNQYFQPFKPDLVNIESTLNRSHMSKKTEFKDLINNRMSNCHNSQLTQSQPAQMFNNKNNNKNNNNNVSNVNKYHDNVIGNTNPYQTNKFTNKDKNNDRLSNLIPLSNNSHLNLNNNAKNMSNTRIGQSSNEFLDENGNLKSNISQTNSQQFKQKGHFIDNNDKKPSYISDSQYQFINQNIMTVGRLPESNQSSRVNFKDKANQRLQDLISLPRTCSLPVVPVNQSHQKNLWKNDKKNSQNMKNRINELNPNYQVIVNEMMPINTQLIEYD